MEWIDREKNYPEGDEDDEILVTDGKKVSIYRMVYSKWGHRFRSRDVLNESNPDWTHWMRLPDPPKEKNAATTQSTSPH